MQSFLSTPQVPNSLNLPDSLLVSNVKADSNDGLTAMRTLIVETGKTAVFVSPSSKTGITLTSDRPIFNKTLGATPHYLVAEIRSAPPQSENAKILVIVDAKQITTDLASITKRSGQGVTVLEQLKILPSPQSSIAIPAKVIASTADQLIVKPEIPGLLNTANSTKLSIDNPPERPVSGSNVWLRLTVKNDVIQLAWSKSEVGNATLLSRTNQQSQAALPLKQWLMAKSQQAVAVPQKTLLKHTQNALLVKPDLVGQGEIKRQQFSFQTRLPTAVALINQGQQESPLRLKADVKLTDQTVLKNINLAKLPVVTTTSTDPKVDKKQLTELLKTLPQALPLPSSSEGTSKLNNNHKALLAESIRLMLRVSLPKQSPLPDIGQVADTLVKDMRNQTSAKSLQKNIQSRIHSQTETFAKNLESLFTPKVEANNSPDKGNIRGPALVQYPLANAIRQTMLDSVFSFNNAGMTSIPTATPAQSLVTALMQILSLYQSIKAPTDTREAIRNLIEAKARPKSQANTSTVANVSQESEAPILKRVMELMANHQLNKLTSAEGNLSGQEQLYYALPASGLIKSPTEFLVRPIGEEEREKTEGQTVRHGWQLNMKLNIGKWGDILAKSVLTDTSLNLDLYTDKERLLPLIKKSLGVLEQRLIAVGLPEVSLSAQQGHVPPTLKPQSLHLLEVSV